MFVEKEIPIYIEKEVEKIKYVDKPVTVEKEVFVDRIVEHEVEIPVYVEKIVQDTRLIEYLEEQLKNH